MTTQTTTPETQFIDRVMKGLTLVSGRQDGYEYIDLETVERVLHDELTVYMADEHRRVALASDPRMLMEDAAEYARQESEA